MIRSMVSIRTAKASEYSEISAIGTANYPENLYEGDESLKSKMEGYPDGCLVADLDGVVGYIISFPYMLGKPYPIDEIYNPEGNPDCYYIHNLCVMPEFRKKGIARMLARRVLEFRWPVVCLVAVMESERFWHKLGFRGFAEIDYYGLSAEYMLKIK